MLVPREFAALFGAESWTLFFSVFLLTEHINVVLFKFSNNQQRLVKTLHDRAIPQKNRKHKNANKLDKSKIPK